MCFVNGPGPLQGIKQAEESLSGECCRGSGEPLNSIHTTWIPSTTSIPPASAMPAFEPRSFPPPSLAGVPVEYIIEQLHTLAPGYWNHPETADCTLCA